MSLSKKEKVNTVDQKRLRKLRKKKDKAERHTKWVSSLFLIPSVLGTMIFFFLPYFVVVRYSLLDNPINAEFVKFQNYSQVAQNNAFRTAIHNTVVFAGWAVPLAVVLSLFLAVVLDSRIPFHSAFRSFFLSPMMVPVASIVLIWQVLFDYNGVVNAIATKYGMDKIDWMKSDKALLVIVILFLWKNLGYNMILFLAALSSVPKDLVEVSQLDGASHFQVFFKIKLRFLASTMVFVTIMSLINSFKIFREVYLLTTDYPYESIYMLQHFMNNKFRSLDYQTLSAAAVMMSLGMVVIILILFGLENFFSKDIEG